MFLLVFINREFMLHRAVKIFRQYHGLSQIQVATSIGITKTEVIQIESGKRPISEEEMISYSKLFDIPASSLVFFSESINSKRKSEKFKKIVGNQFLDITEWLNNRGKEKQNRQ